jgi:hypothetical protein
MSVLLTNRGLGCEVQDTVAMVGELSGMMTL